MSDPSEPTPPEEGWRRTREGASLPAAHSPQAPPTQPSEENARYQLLWIAEHMLEADGIEPRAKGWLSELLARHQDDPETALLAYLRANATASPPVPGREGGSAAGLPPAREEPGTHIQEGG